MMYRDKISGILVFKTNISSEQDVLKVAAVLVEEEGIKKWNVDRQDEDRILRIESAWLTPKDIIRCVECAGFQCEELMD